MHSIVLSSVISSSASLCLQLSAAELRPPECKTTNWPDLSLQTPIAAWLTPTLSQWNWRLNIRVHYWSLSPAASKLISQSQRTNVLTDSMGAALADSLAPRSGGIWKKFHIRIIPCQLTRIDENCSPPSKSSHPPTSIPPFQLCFNADWINRPNVSLWSEGNMCYIKE